MRRPPLARPTARGTAGCPEAAGPACTAPAPVLLGSRPPPCQRVEAQGSHQLPTPHTTGAPSRQRGCAFLTWRAALASRQALRWPRSREGGTGASGLPLLPAAAAPRRATWRATRAPHTLGQPHVSTARTHELRCVRSGSRAARLARPHLRACVRACALRLASAPARPPRPPLPNSPLPSWHAAPLPPPRPPAAPPPRPHRLWSWGHRRGGGQVRALL